VLALDSRMPVANYTSNHWSRLIRFIPSSSRCDFANGDSHAAQWVFGEPIDPEQDVGLAMAEATTVEAWILEGEVPWKAMRRTGEKAVVSKLLSPLSAEMSGMIRCIGLNFKDHAAELNMALPKIPSVFYKPAHTLADPNSVIPVPKCAQEDEADYEVELAVVIGRTCKDVAVEDAMDCVLGWTCANDLTARARQRESSQWSFSKGFDHFCPLGPCLVSARHLLDPHTLSLQTRVNGELLQNGTTKQMIFSIPQIIAYISQGTTLPAGTVIITGTPPGIGDGRTPKIWLKEGDDVRCWISGGIGTLANSITNL